MDNATTDFLPISTATVKCLYSYWHEIPLSGTYNIYNFVLFFPLTILFGFIGLVGNTLAFIVIGYEKPFTSTSVLLRSLALADNLVLLAFILIRSLICLPDYLGVFLAYIEFYEVSFRYLWTIRWFTKTVSIYVTVCVAAERYIAVRRPLRVAYICTIRNARIAVAVITILSFAFQSPTLVYTETSYAYDECTGRMMPYWDYSAIGNNRYYLIIFTYVFGMFLLAVFPTCVLIFFAVSLVSALKAAAKSYIAREQSDCSKRKDKTKPVTVRVIAVVVIFVVLESPGSLWQISAIVKEFNLNKLTEVQFNMVQNFTYFLGYLDSVVNFYVYCLLGKRFRRSFMRVFSKVPRLKNSSSSLNGSISATNTTSI